MCENLNAEIASGTISAVAEAVGYLNWTYYARRMRSNPSYYHAKSGSDEDVDFALLAVVKDTLAKLTTSGCVEYNEKDASGVITPTPLGIASCSYYLLHETPRGCYGWHHQRFPPQSLLPTSLRYHTHPEVIEVR